jgi:cytochrome c-type biogenesis protein CcmE
MRSSKKYIFGAASIVTLISYLAYLGAASSWQYYLSVDEAAADSAYLIGKRIRVSGHVAVGSLKIDANRRVAEFRLTGARRTLYVTCRCAMPDNLVENIDVVVEGTLQADGIHGHKIMTRCASKYESRDRMAMQPSAPSSSALR